MTDYQILLYYKYVPLVNPESWQKHQLDLCHQLHLKGRIIIASEGINGTVEGTTGETEAYIKELTSHPEFTNIHFKRSPGTGTAFPKLSIKLRDDIVSNKITNWNVNPCQQTGKYLSAQQLHDWIHSDREFYIVDMRNDFEHASGHFINSVLPPISRFRDLPQAIPQLAHLKGKTIVTVCTGGVRCEKASAFLLQSGFADVYQLYGGIVTYMETFPNEDFLGQLYVFDNRVLMGFNSDSIGVNTGQSDRTIVGRCELCQQSSESYINCANNDCHRHFICCDQCSNKQAGTLCQKCNG